MFSYKEKRNVLQFVGKVLLLQRKLLMAVFIKMCTLVLSNFHFSCKLCLGCMFFGNTWWSLDKTTIIL